MVASVRVLGGVLGSQARGAWLGQRFRLVTAGALSAILVAGALVSWSPASDAANNAPLKTCVNLATGEFRLQGRGVCNPVTEMPHRWVALVDKEVSAFSSRTLAQAVVLNTGGDTSGFTKKDWAQLQELKAANVASSSGDTRTSTVTGTGTETGTVSGSVVESASLVAAVNANFVTCVNDVTGVVRIPVNGTCKQGSESKSRWVAEAPLQKPVIESGAPGIGQVTGVRASNGEVTSVSFSPPADVGSSPITSITLIAVPGGKSVTISGGAAGIARFVGLDPDVKYTFLVVASNASGAGPRIPAQLPDQTPTPTPATAQTQTPAITQTPALTQTPTSGGGGSTGGGSTPAEAPGAAMTVAGTAGNTTVALTWVTPVDTGGAAISGYSVQVSTSSGGSYVNATGCTSATSSTSLLCTATGLTNATTYYFKVAAINSVGTGAYSTASASITPAVTAPDAATTVAGTPGNTTVALTWVTPVDTGGAAISGYSVQVSTSSGGSYVNATGCTSATSSTSLLCTATGLTNATTYYFKVAAINSVGTGAYSTASASITPTPTAPGAATTVAGTAGNTTVALTWVTPVDTGGAAISGYSVQVSTSSGGSYVNATGCTSATSSTSLLCTATSLTNATTYYFKVAAINSVGTGAYSTASASITPVYALGDTGPGGGLIFLISGGLTYEMAPKTWSGSSSDDTPILKWCNIENSNITGAVGTALGTGSANTTAMQSPACASGTAVSARAYLGGGLTDWFLPSKSELNAMCNYSRNPSSPALPSVACSGQQNLTFSSSTYGFQQSFYWGSSQDSTVGAWGLGFDGVASEYLTEKGTSLRIRPIRAF